MGAHGWSSARPGLVVCGYLALFCGDIVLRAEAGCRERESPNCCTGRNNECFEYTRRKTVCYCDAYCQKTGDCCEDYQRVCQVSGLSPTSFIPLSGLMVLTCVAKHDKACQIGPRPEWLDIWVPSERRWGVDGGGAAIDCVVGSWGPWSSCTSACGVGSTERSRQVSVPPRNGGTPCPDLKQRRGCFGNNAICRTAKEVAKILPDSFKRNFKDPWRRPHMLMREEKSSYCVQLRVKQASAACKLKVWSAQLLRDRVVCAECQSEAMSKSDQCAGDGLQGISGNRVLSAASPSPLKQALPPLDAEPLPLTRFPKGRKARLWPSA
ncbi:hypothetical protein Q5P01_015068 [Channa striata]|uniref:SMB domain-containing protein n=1 Tax=Channa striata TaxID=64152 RepID=A0AA88MGL7_CHASR|nr:hypothetical protein Q5P01_015068 [Channa striata]